MSLEPKPARESPPHVVLVDLSGLEIDNNGVDIGVTSGADPSSWDPIDVGEDARGSSCVEEGGKSGGKGAAVCQSQEPASQH